MKHPQPRHTVPSHPSLRHPGRWLWLLLLVPILIGLARLHFDVEIFDLLPSDLPAARGLKLYQQHFANARELIIAVKAAGRDQAQTAARTIAERLRPLTNLVASVVWEPPWLEHPDQAAELLAYLWFNQPPEAFSELTNRLAPDKLAATLKAAREELATSLSPEAIGRLTYDPFDMTRLPESSTEVAPSFSHGEELFSSSAGGFRILFVRARSDLRTYHDCSIWLSRIKEAATDAVRSGDGLSGVSLGYTGRPAFYAEVAGGMEHDITISVGGTAAIIAMLFWMAHRRLKPMLWLLALLTLILGSTLALGGLIFGTINVVSMGFAAILLGLAVDYAVVHYQEALVHPDLSIPQIRHAIAPSIFWAAVTTITAFLMLNFGGLPGLGQLGTLVGLGVALAALIMIFEFLPPLFPDRNAPKPRPTAFPFASAHGGRDVIHTGSYGESSHQAVGRARFFSPLRIAMVFGITAAIAISAGVILFFGLPPIDPTANSLRPRNSQAYAALDEVQAMLDQQREPLWLIVRGPTVAEVARLLDRVQATLSSAGSNQKLGGFTIPAALWPHPEFQAVNRSLAARLAEERRTLRQVAQANGFAPSSLVLTEGMLDTWRCAGQTDGVFWPTNEVSRWILQKVTASSASNWFALGLISGQTSGKPSTGIGRIAALESELPGRDVWLCGWELLGEAIFSRVKANMWKVVCPMVVLVLASLYFAFRRPAEILLSLTVLLLSGICLLGVMRVTGWKWNLLNLMAIPLVLGTGVDYSIFMQLALRRHGGDLDIAYRSVGRALLLCGGTAVAGFGSLACSSNAGMASLGQVCATGIGSNMLIAIFLLPTWWQRTAGRTRTSGGAVRQQGVVASASAPESPRSTPSSLYRSEFWRLGIWAVRLLPGRVCSQLGVLAVAVYWTLAWHRREIVVGNLMPALRGDAYAARAKARALFRQFALKLIDLWRFEAGLQVNDLLGQTSGWEHFTAAQEQRRGVLLLTPHLGNWEFGGPLLTSRGVGLQVLTLAEPGRDFTEMRQASRARCNIETLVVGNDPLAFLEVIRRLESGATVALLVDRPPPPTAIAVELFGRPFCASVAAAELARASGCVLLPVYLPRDGERYEAHILPAIPYDRASLRDREERRRLTQTVISTFEPVIREHLDQWFHFVPVWPTI